MITISHLSVAYGLPEDRYQALDDIDLALPEGEIYAIIGPSGCGKSTLLKVLAGIIQSFAGSVQINGQPLNPQQQTIGFIPQNYGLLPWKNVVDNILLGVNIKYQDTTDAQKSLPALLQQLGLQGLENRYPGELSGGQQQRVALARSFLLKPDLLLMDEPFSALDAITREEIQAVFLNTWRQRPVSTVLVTHHVEEAVYLGRKIVILTGRPGIINTVIDNPLFGGTDIRSSHDFFQLCLGLRQKLKKEWTL
jgi:NitT/TauT family transport system ATP-binding protein